MNGEPNDSCIVEAWRDNLETMRKLLSLRYGHMMQVQDMSDDPYVFSTYFVRVPGGWLVTTSNSQGQAFVKEPST
jgi:hypothetical protein